jgi:hypothetical protein
METPKKSRERSKVQEERERRVNKFINAERVKEIKAGRDKDVKKYVGEK